MGSRAGGFWSRWRSVVWGLACLLCQRAQPASQFSQHALLGVNTSAMPDPSSPRDPALPVEDC